jgi:enterochelin esterase-like enzyme
MKYKQAGMIGVALSLAVTGLACNPVVSTSVLKPSVLQGSVPLLSKTSAVVTETEAPLSYKLETYNSRAMGGRRTYGVSLPPGYEENPNQHYPVVFLLHGGHGTPTSWFEKDKGAALGTLQQLYTSGKLPPCIIITPDGYDERGTSSSRDPQYIDGPNGKIDTDIGDELVRVVQSRYRTLPAPDFWAIGGLSSGAWGAINVGLHHLNHFSILFSHSGYFRDASGSKNSPMDFVKMLSSQQRRQLRIYLDTGKEDTSFLNENREFHAILNRLKVTNILHEFPGEHTWRYWRQHLANSLAFVGEQFEHAQEPQLSENQGFDSANRSTILKIGSRE